MSDTTPLVEKSIEEKKLDFEYARLKQEKELKEKEREEQSKKGLWTAPWVTAITAGILGLSGTFYNGCQSTLLEKKKQEGTLILEAIKTGTGQTKQAASNLLFLYNAGLIDLDDKQREQLVKETGTANPLPALPQQSEKITFESSAEVSKGVRDTLQATIDAYLTYLVNIGFPANKKGVTVFLNPELTDNVYYNVEKERVEVGPAFAKEKDEVLHPYTVRLLMEHVGEWSKKDTTEVFQCLLMGASEYLVCSSQNDPLFGEQYIQIMKRQNPDFWDSPFLRNQVNQDPFHKAIEPHACGTAWGGALWEIRNSIGRETIDKMLLQAWKKINPEKLKDEKGVFFFSDIIQADKELNNGKNVELITSVFKKRGLF